MTALVVVLMVITMFSASHSTQIDTCTLKETLRKALLVPFRISFPCFAGITGVSCYCFIGWFKISDQMLGVVALPFIWIAVSAKTDVGTGVETWCVDLALRALCGRRFWWYDRAYKHAKLTGILILSRQQSVLFIAGTFLAPRDFHARDWWREGVWDFGNRGSCLFICFGKPALYPQPNMPCSASIITLPGKVLAGLSGYLVTAMGYPGFFVLSSVIVVPAIGMYFGFEIPGDTLPLNRRRLRVEGSEEQRGIRDGLTHSKPS